MFIGHYGPAFAGKAAVRSVPLWVMFVAVQFMDLLWSVLVLAGIEKVRIVPGLMQGSDLDLFYMPYTHSLAGAAALAVLFGALIALAAGRRRAGVFAACAAAVFSHWLLDLVVHRPDLMIYDGVKAGFGLWRWLWISLPLELISLTLGAWVYVRRVPARRGGNLIFWGFVALLAAVQLYTSFGSPLTSIKGAATTALVAYIVLAGAAALVDLTRAKQAGGA
jgi:hypothetical protein